MAHGTSFAEAYRIMARTLESVAAHLLDRGIGTVSLYLLSTHNLRRSAAELADVYAAEIELCERLPAVLGARDARAAVAGDLALVDPGLRDAAGRAVEATAAGSRLVNLCIAYDPRLELAHAFAGAATPDELLASLWVTEPVDVVIRTSGSRRLSDFLPLQAAYAELYFLPMPFPDLTTRDVDAVLADFGALGIRHGL